MSATQLRRRWWSCLAALLVVALTTGTRAQTPSPAPPAERGSIWIAAGGAFQDSHEAFGTRLTLTRFLETAVVEGEYKTRGGPLIEVSAGLPLGRGFGVQGGSSIFTKPHRGVIRGSIPHPLFFGQPRQGEVEIGDLAHREIALRAELAWTRAVWSKLQLSLSGGPAAIHVQQALVGEVETNETSYPFETINLVPRTVHETGWGIGGTAAVDLTWFVRRRVGVGVTGRFTHAHVGLERIKLSVGGASAIVGVRFVVH